MAGVSTATVSRVINQTAWVEPVTRERVEKAMRDLNYRRNAAAIALAKRSGDMLGLLTGNLADPFFARLARGVEDGALCRATGDTVIPGHYAAAQQQSFQCRTGDSRFCRALFFTVNASSTVKTVMTIKLTLLM